MGGPPSTSGRTVQPLAAQKESPETVACTAAPNTPQTAHHATRLLWLSKASRMMRSEEHTSELQSLAYLVCRLLLEKKKKAQVRLSQHPLQPLRKQSGDAIRASSSSRTNH